MSHPAALIQQIRGLLERDYQPSQYRYAIERAIRGTRMYPDIAIYTPPPENRIVCAVEIGYTRPEKLAAYRHDHRIPDVRWYDKRGHLHADVEEKIVKVRLELTCTPAAARVSVYSVEHKTACYDRDCVEELAAWTDDEEAIDNARYEDVWTLVITDRIKVFLPSYCDKCGSTWLADPEDEALEIGQDLATCTPREFGLYYGAATGRSWPEIREQVRNQFGLELDYTAGYFVRDEDGRSLETRMRLMREQSKRDDEPERSK